MDKRFQPHKAGKMRLAVFYPILDHSSLSRLYQARFIARQRAARPQPPRNLPRYQTEKQKIIAAIWLFSQIFISRRLPARRQVFA
ncbi:hypothetical protein DPQ22_05950 [Candidatus Tokpelaia sp.]|nr:hypothetical protein DPQ22_05950 [Candidatus Tokpelaia sp.]